MQSSRVCPECNKDDQIEKVSSIVKNDIRTREETEWITDKHTDKDGKEHSFLYPIIRNIIESTELARSLVPPKRPESPRKTGAFENFLESCNGVIMLLIDIGGLAYGLYAIFLNVLPGGRDWLTFCTGGASIGVGVFAFWVMSSQRRRSC